MKISKPKRIIQKELLEHSKKKVIYKKLPIKIRIPDIENITGHSLNTMKLTLNPVNNERMAKPKSINEQSQ